jgi:cardiolipin synthase
MIKSKLGVYPFRYGNKIELLKSGDEYFSKLIELVESAQSEIHLQVYIFESDATGELVRDSLIAAAKRGVKIFLVLDAFGSKNINSIWHKNFADHQIDVYFYSPIKFNTIFKMGLRMHHKIVCIDRKYTLLGGINISDNYNFIDNQIPWLDYAIFIEGSLIQDLYQICIQTLKKVQVKKTINKQISVKPDLAEGPIKARVLQNNWLQAKIGITKQYKTQIRNANEQITLVTSYFIPPLSMKRLLIRAAMRGVKVKIVIGAISDVGLAKRATDFFKSDLLKSGIRIYEWKESVLHAKLASIDKTTVNIGSYNFNHLSDFGSIECNVEINDLGFCKKINNMIDNIIENGCDELSFDKIERKGRLFNQLFNAFSYFMFRFMLKLLLALQSSKKKINKYNL